ncbi:uncharacterized protein LOC110252582 [Exaiptasia diaphana]|uniref:Uncharacterized protein n=1 Tax=Exaiptasia diaphana TaxID=2652724 RepID=A0A913Y4N8_EXADI|nr:uncharacterized protein LOC110252582 [Exaiptasia diaphana]KXJ22398.1 hypothetical protein AC249_AIPGENE27441 [Exaiptasia diaphana]
MSPEFGRPTTMRLWVFFSVLFLGIATKHSLQQRQRNPWLLHKRLLPDSKIQCRIPWGQCVARRNCTARLDCMYRKYECVERDDGKKTSQNSNSSKLMGKCKERIKTCLTKRTCRKKLTCVLFRIYQCERLHRSKQRSYKRIYKKLWAAKIRKKILRKRQRLYRKYKKKNKRRNKQKRNRKP